MAAQPITAAASRVAEFNTLGSKLKEMITMKGISLLAMVLLAGPILHATTGFPNEQIERQSDKAGIPCRSPGIAAIIQKLKSHSIGSTVFIGDDIRKLGDQAVSAIPFLVEILGDDTQIPSAMDMSPGRAAAMALAAIGEPAVDFLIPVLGDNNPTVRCNAALALKFIGSRRSLEAATIAVLDDSDPRVNSLILVWGETTGISPAIQIRVVDALIRRLRDKDPSLRRDAVNVLRDYRDPRVVEPLVMALKDEYYEVRNAAAFALGFFNDTRAIEPLIKALDDGHPRVRGNAAISLGRMGDIRAQEALIRTLEYAIRQNEPYLAESAAAVLRSLTGEDFGQDHEKCKFWWKENRSNAATKFD